MHWLPNRRAAWLTNSGSRQAAERVEQAEQQRVGDDENEDRGELEGVESGDGAQETRAPAQVLKVVGEIDEQPDEQQAAEADAEDRHELADQVAVE